MARQGRTFTDEILLALIKKMSKGASAEAKAYADMLFESVKDGVKYQGSVPTADDLPEPTSSNKGHMYTTDDDGHEHLSNGASWVDLSQDLVALGQRITALENGKVDKVTGKGLSENDYTDEDKNKLAGIEDGAEVSHDFVTRRYEGVDLAVKFASEIATQGSIGAWLKWRCQQNKLDDLFPHDYFTITFKNGSILKAEIAGIDQYLHNGDTEITKHHIDFITKDCWSPTVQYNKVNYNNGIGLDKFTGDGTETTFQLTHRANGNFPALSKVTVGGTEVSNYTYDVTTGQLVFDSAPTGVIKAIWTDAVLYPILASNVYAYLNSLKMGVPNEAAADPTLTEVDYTSDGIWYNMPDDLKAVIVNKRFYTGQRFTLGSLRTSDSSGGWIDLGKIWIPDEIEVYGYPVWANYQYTIMFGRQYPCFKNGNRTKGAGNGGGCTYWWLMPAHAGNSTRACYVDISGSANNYTTSYAGVRVAFGFRISA